MRHALARSSSHGTQGDTGGEAPPLSSTYLDADGAEEDSDDDDKTYGTRAAYIDGLDFDPATFFFSGQKTAATDATHLLSLVVSEAALASIGKELPREILDDTSVIVGNTLTGEFSRSATMRLRWPFVAKTIRRALHDLGHNPHGPLAERILHAARVRFKSVFPPTTEDTLAGGLSNTIAGHISKRHALKAGAYTVDGACASSLIALSLACDALISGRSKCVLFGGVDLSLDTFELVGFSRAGALAKGDMSVYGENAAGFLPGEGCGFMVAMRRGLAEEIGCDILGVVDAWSVGSDGSGGVMEPITSGQARCIHRAYELSGSSMKSVDFVEGHGTGTTRGDEAELRAISTVHGAAVLESGGGDGSKVEEEAKDAESRGSMCGVTSLKSIMGHTKAASGIGAAIKALIAVNQRVIPPTAGIRGIRVSPLFRTLKDVYPVLDGRVCRRSSGEDGDAVPASIRAGVSGMGFGGINVHCCLSSPPGPPDARFTPAIPEQQMLSSDQDAEILLFGDSNLAGLIEQLTRAESITRACSCAELTDYSVETLRSFALAESTTFRCTVVARFPSDAADGLACAVRAFTGPGATAVLAEGEVRSISVPRGTDGENAGVLHDGGAVVFVSHAAVAPRVGFVFPGQGSQRVGMSKILTRRFPDLVANMLADDPYLSESPGGDELRESMLAMSVDLLHPEYIGHTDAADRTERLSDTRWSQPALVLAECVWVQFLRDMLGVHPTCATGHSLGEISALHVAGALTAAEAVHLAMLRGEAMASAQGGSMLSVSAAVAIVEGIIAEAVPGGGSSTVSVSNINAPKRTVVSGLPEGIDAIEALCGERRVPVNRLRVRAAFHTQHMAAAAAKFVEDAAPLLARISARLSSATANGGGLLPLEDVGLYSTRTGRRLDAADVTTGLGEHLRAQIVEPVRFTDTCGSISKDAACDVMLEVGPGRSMTTLMSECFAASHLTRPVKPVSGAVSGPAASGPIEVLPLEPAVGEYKGLLSVCARLIASGAALDTHWLHARRFSRPLGAAPGGAAAATSSSACPAKSSKGFLVASCELPSSPATAPLAPRPSYVQLGRPTNDASSTPPGTTGMLLSVPTASGRGRSGSRMSAVSGHGGDHHRMGSDAVPMPSSSIGDLLAEHLSPDEAEQLPAYIAERAAFLAAFIRADMARVGAAGEVARVQRQDENEAEDAARKNVGGGVAAGSAAAGVVVIVGDGTSPDAEGSAVESGGKGGDDGDNDGDLDGDGVDGGDGGKGTEKEEGEVTVEMVVNAVMLEARKIVGLEVKPDSTFEEIGIDSIKRARLVTASGRAVGIPAGEVAPTADHWRSMVVVREMGERLFAEQRKSAAKSKRTGKRGRAYSLAPGPAAIPSSRVWVESFSERWIPRDAAETPAGGEAKIDGDATVRTTATTGVPVPEVVAEPGTGRDSVSETSAVTRLTRGRATLSRTSDAGTPRAMLTQLAARSSASLGAVTIMSLLGDAREATFVQPLRNALDKRFGVRVESLRLTEGGTDPVPQDDAATIVVVVPSARDTSGTSGTTCEPSSLTNEREALWFLASIARVVNTLSEASDRTVTVFFSSPPRARYPCSAFAASMCLESHGDAAVTVCTAQFADGGDDNPSCAVEDDSDTDDLFLQVTLDELVRAAAPERRSFHRCRITLGRVPTATGEGAPSSTTSGLSATVDDVVMEHIAPPPEPTNAGTSAAAAAAAVIVTGGAKGITAECVLAMAKSDFLGKMYKRLVLMGRGSRDSKEVAANVARIEATGAEVVYVSGDVTSLEDCARAVAAATEGGVRIAGLVHGAARNVATEAASVDADVAVTELAPKVRGLRQLMAALEAQCGAACELDFIACLSSIIAVTGMSSSSVYGFSNQVMEADARRMSVAHRARCVLLRYSHWAEVGMAAAMGSSEFLDNMGMSSIDVARGTALFVGHIAAALATPGSTPADMCTAVVITSRMGSLSTWLEDTARAKAARAVAPETTPLVGVIESILPRVEASSTFAVSLQRLPYLSDHVIKGTIVIPAVVLLELTAQTILCMDVAPVADPGVRTTPLLRGLRSQPITISDVVFANAIDVPSLSSEPVAAHVIRDISGAIHFEIRAGSSDFAVVATSGKFEIGEPESGDAGARARSPDLPHPPGRTAAPPDVQRLAKLLEFRPGDDATTAAGDAATAKPSKVPVVPRLPLRPSLDLYGKAGVLFHGPRFQRIAALANAKWNDDEHYGTATLILSGLPTAPQSSPKPVLAPGGADGGGSSTTSSGKSSSSSSSGGPTDAELASQYLLGDFFLRDSILQAAKTIIPKHGALPAGVRSVKMFPAWTRIRGEVAVQIDIAQVAGPGVDASGKARFTCNAVAVGIDDATGEASVVEIWEGLALSDLYVDDSLPSSADLCDPSARDEAALRTALRSATWALCTTCPDVAVRSGQLWHLMTREARHEVQAEMLLSLGEKRAVRRPKKSAESSLVKSGRPQLIPGNGDAHGVPSISITHTDLVCAIAHAPINHPHVGIDFSPIPLGGNKHHIRRLMTERRREIALLVEHGDTEDMAASRIWAAFEAAFKADNSIPFESMEVLPSRVRYEQSVLVHICRRGETDAERALKIVTFPTRWTLGPDLMAAFVVGAESPFPPLIPSVDAMFESGVIWKLREADASEGLGMSFRLRVPITFRECSSPARRVPAHVLVDTIGHLRECTMRIVNGTLHDLAHRFSTLGTGSVTDTLSLHVYRTITVEDVLEARFTMASYTDTSTVLGVRFLQSAHRDGTLHDADLCAEQVVASAIVQVSSVRINEQGIAARNRWPLSFFRFLIGMDPKRMNTGDLEPPGRPGRPAGQSVAELLGPRYGAPSATNGTSGSASGSASAASGLLPSRAVHVSFVETTTLDGNLVGNIYFSRYATWQGEALDAFAKRAAPSLFPSTGAAADLTIVETSFDFDVESLPFDAMTVHVYVRALHQCGARFEFVFRRWDPETGAIGEELLRSHATAVLAVHNDAKAILEPRALPWSLAVACGADPTDTSVAWDRSGLEHEGGSAGSTPGSDNPAVGGTERDGGGDSGSGGGVVVVGGSGGDPSSSSPVSAPREPALSTASVASSTSPSPATQGPSSAAVGGGGDDDGGVGIVSGWLYKRGEQAYGAWKRRWVVLSGNIITYAKSPDAKKSQGSIDLATASQLETYQERCIRKDREVVESDRKKMATFFICTPHRDYRFMAESAADYRMWFTAIQFAMTSLKSRAMDNLRS